MSETWVQPKIAADFGALTAHTEPFQQLLSGTICAEAAAKRIVSSNLKRHDDTAWRLWQLIFDAAAELPQYQNTIIEPLLALQTQHEDATDDPELTAWIRKVGSSWRDRRDI